MVVHRLVPEVYLADDFVLRAGDPGHAVSRATAHQPPPLLCEAARLSAR